jgi:hypothetical protein
MVQLKPKEKMMIQKHPIMPQRIRTVPPQFSWVDQRLVRDRHIERITHAAAALYLFLVAVGDHQGLSYYSDASVMVLLSMDPTTMEGARRTLLTAELIAYQKPLYQVLALDPPAPGPSSRTPMDRPVSIGSLFKQMMGGAA